MHDTSESATRTGLFARLAVVAAIAYQLLLIALILVRPEIDPAHKPISEYAIGRLGWLAVLGFQSQPLPMRASWSPSDRRCGTDSAGSGSPCCRIAQSPRWRSAFALRTR